MPIAVIRLEAAPTGNEVSGEGTNPTDEQMKEEQDARRRFLDFVEPKLAELPNRPSFRAGNVSRVELMGANEWSKLNHYLLLLDFDVGRPRIELDELLPPGTTATEVGSYSSLQTWPPGDPPPSG